MTRARSGSEALGCFSLPRCRSQQAVRRCDAHVGAPQALIGQNSDTPPRFFLAGSGRAGGRGSGGYGQRVDAHSCVIGVRLC